MRHYICSKPLMLYLPSSDGDGNLSSMQNSAHTFARLHKPREANHVLLQFLKPLKKNIP